MENNTKKSDIDNLSSAEKSTVIMMLQEQVLLLKEKVKRLEARLRVLEGKAKKNSRNSSKPPSSDLNKIKVTSSKSKSDKSPGGQPGHQGHNLKMVKKPDEIISLKVASCNKCGNDLRKAKASIVRRQVFEIPKPKMVVTEYQAEEKDCKACGYTTSACFPSGVTNPTQYGIRARSLMVYMNQYQFIPYARASEFFTSVYGHKVSPATIINTVGLLGKRLSSLDKEIKLKLARVKLAHGDETSMSVNGTKQWLHTVGTKKLTHYALHPNRGQKATADIGILPKFKGTLIHDHWKSYFFYKNSSHALCNAHHLRELIYINENHNMQWAAKMYSLLIKIKNHKIKYIGQRQNKFSTYLLNKYDSDYNEILTIAQREQARRGTIDSHNLIKRLLNYKAEVLLFMHKFKVPFTNNLSEQDLRMAKIKQKISGCFRNIDWGDHFCKIRTLLITAKKNDKNTFEIIQEAFTKIITLDELVTA